MSSVPTLWLRATSELAIHWTRSHDSTYPMPAMYSLNGSMLLHGMVAP
uniref:Uncharacterized protein n=1 Tax=Arundo donax TaxID=35708 RepID=A0A0A8XXG9_ARUDO